MYLLCIYWSEPDKAHTPWSETAQKNLWSFENVDWLKIHFQAWSKVFLQSLP